MLILLAAYLIGSIPFAILVARWWDARDPRLVGSGNPGATNVLRASGAIPGISVALLDAAKGAMSVLLADRMQVSAGMPAAVGVAAVLGHLFPVWTGFRGGKGVATAAGAFSVLAPVATTMAFAIFVLAVWVTRVVSIGSLLASASLSPLVYATGGAPAVFAAAALVGTMILIRHRTNVMRLWHGTERRVD